jgi:hypothetical protein
MVLTAHDFASHRESREDPIDFLLSEGPTAATAGANLDKRMKIGSTCNRGGVPQLPIRCKRSCDSDWKKNAYISSATFAEFAIAGASLTELEKTEAVKATAPPNPPATGRQPTR